LFREIYAAARDLFAGELRLTFIFPLKSITICDGVILQIRLDNASRRLR
jgi:hypothetical protein